MAWSPQDTPAPNALDEWMVEIGGRGLAESSVRVSCLLWLRAFCGFVPSTKPKDLTTSAHQKYNTHELHDEINLFEIRRFDMQMSKGIRANTKLIVGGFTISASHMLENDECDGRFWGKRCRFSRISHYMLLNFASHVLESGKLCF